MAEKEKISLVVDTNILLANGSEWKDFLVVHEYYDCTIYLSPIVLYEYTALQIEDVKSHLELIGSLANKLRKRTKKSKREA